VEDEKPTQRSQAGGDPPQTLVPSGPAVHAWCTLAYHHPLSLLNGGKAGCNARKTATKGGGNAPIQLSRDVYPGSQEYGEIRTTSPRGSTNVGKRSRNALYSHKAQEEVTETVQSQCHADTTGPWIRQSAEEIDSVNNTESANVRTNVARVALCVAQTETRRRHTGATSSTRGTNGRPAQMYSALAWNPTAASQVYCP
jgi:hypothetical protein